MLGRLTVLGEGTPVILKGNSYRTFTCRCECGTVKDMLLSVLSDGERGARSCGCLQREAVTKHGKEGTRIYKIWRGIIERITVPTNKNYPLYGGRGITMDERWKDFEAFYADVGDPPGDEFTIDRIDNNGNYTKANCHWATKKQQANNTRNNVILTLHGRSQTAAMWAEELGINPATLRNRIRAGWSHERALTEPVHIEYKSR